MKTFFYVWYRLWVGLLFSVLLSALSGTVRAQIISTVAGNGTQGFSGDGGPATSARLSVPRGVAVDELGNLYIADLENNRVRRVTPGGVISTVAGSGNRGFGGDGGPATSASLYSPTGVAVDKSGALYIADQGNNRVRRVTPGGVISTVAGNGTAGFSGDGGAAASASLNSPPGVAVDELGTLYIADMNNNRIRRVTPSGVISTVAGNGAPSYGGNGEAATSAGLNAPVQVAVDKSGALYIADQGNNRVRRVTPDGIISTVAGNGSRGSGGDGNPAISANLDSPTGVVVDESGNLYIAEPYSNRVRRVTPDGIISTVAGNGAQGSSGDGGAATSASLDNPRRVTLDGAGNLYIAETGNSRVRKVALNTAPTVGTRIPDQKAVFGQPFSYTLPTNAFTDNTPNSLTYTVSLDPENIGLRYDAVTRVILGTPMPILGGTSVYVTVRATDPAGLTANQRFVIIVSCPAFTAYSVTGGGGYCTGGTGVAVGLDGSTTGVTYQLAFFGIPIGRPVAGTGQAISFGNQIGAGTYTVQTSTSSFACSQVMSGSATVRISPALTPFTVTGGGGDFCSGGAVVGLSGSQTGVSYQLLRDEQTEAGSPLAGTGSALDFGKQTVAGVYTVRATTAGGGCQQTMTGTVGVVVLTSTLTAYDVTAGGAYCAGDAGVTVGLVGSTPSVSYQLLLEGRTVGNPVIGTGVQLSFGNQTAAGTYTVQAASGLCRLTMNGSVPVAINPLPTQFMVAGGGAYCAGGTGVVVGLSGSQTGVAYQLLLNGNVVGSSMAGTGSELTFGNQTTGGSYTVQATNASTSCQQTMSGTATVIVNALPTVFAVAGGGAYCTGSNGVAVSLSGSQTGVNYQLLRDGNLVGSAMAGTGTSLSFGNQTAAGLYTVLATDMPTSCQQVMNGSASITITPLPDAPRLVTQSGYPYPAGVSTLTISQNTGPVSLTGLGCSGGMLMANGNAASSFTITTANTGTQTYTATCTLGGCTSPAGSFQVTVVPTTLSVLHRDADYGNTQNNIIKPYLELANAGDSAIPYRDITVRYWFTSEGNALPTNLALYYAQLGAVNLKYVALSQPRQGAFGYVEYSFPGGGSLNGGANSGPIENGIQKSDGSTFNESDDYSYAANYQNYLPNMRITAYQNGVIVYGQEPTMVSSQTAVAVYSAAKDSPTTSQIQTRLELRNQGNVALPVAGLKLRYYFTSDNNQPANVYVDYADIGAAKVAARVIKLSAPVDGADSYVELSFPGNPMQVNALSSLGVIDFRLVRSDNGLFNQSNDYSYAANYGNVGLNNRVTVLLNNRLIYGTPPSGAPARVGASEPVVALSVQVLGNPVVGNQAAIEITGVGGQAVSLKVVDLQGRAIHEQRIERAGELEQLSLPLGSSRGQLLLRVSTDTQQQSVKLLRP